MHESETIDSEALRLHSLARNFAIDCQASPNLNSYTSFVFDIILTYNMYNKVTLHLLHTIVINKINVV